MDRELLRAVQLTQLEIAKEIRRVCQAHGIRYFLCCGTFLGAVRHGGFIPWDDDMDMGMLRQDYETFCRVAPQALGEDFCLQSWYTEPGYALPFAKVRLRGTLYQEAKGTRLKENGFYVDLFPFDYAPSAAQAQAAYARKLCELFRVKLMKCGNRPWMDGDRIIWKKRLGYLYYQLRALGASSQALTESYDALATSVPPGEVLCRQRGLSRLDCYRAEWYSHLADYDFEGERFPGPEDFDAVLTAQFGDYRTLPPEGERENRHQIVNVDFGPKWGQERGGSV